MGETAATLGLLVLSAAAEGVREAIGAQGDHFFADQREPVRAGTDSP